MDFEEEIFLADNNDSSDIFFAEDAPIVSKEVKETVNEEFSEVDEIYNILKISEKPERVDFKEYFKSNPEIFKIAGVDYYKTLTPEKYAQFENKCESIISKAKELWNSPKLNYKIAELDDALGTLKAIFRTEAATTSYNKELRRNLLYQLYGSFKEKANDKILEVSEIQDLIDIAYSIHLINEESERKQIIEWIKKECEKNNCVIESFQQSFIRHTKDKSKLKRLDTELCKNKLFNEYKNLYNLSLQLNKTDDKKTDSELYEEMYQSLIHENILLNNIQIYIDDFYDVEKNEGKYNFALALNDEYYYYLKGTAIHTYQFTENQWIDFTRKQGLKKTDDASVAFIMGTEKTSTITGLAKLLEDNPNMALSRIRAGDVETYLSHIGQLQLSKMLSAKKEELKNDTDLLVQAVVALLRGIELQDKQVDEEEVNETDSLIPLIERKATPQEIVDYLLRRKQFERLNKKIISNDTNEHKELENYLSQIGFSFQKICLNYLNEFTEENNASVYKNMYETYAKYILESLLLQNDEITILNVLKPILSNGKNMGLISDTLMNEFRDSEQKLIEKLNEDKTTFLENQKMKKKKSFFSFKNK